jgi:hypothetical protein
MKISFRTSIFLQIPHSVMIPRPSFKLLYKHSGSCKIVRVSNNHESFTVVKWAHLRHQPHWLWIHVSRRFTRTSKHQGHLPEGVTNVFCFCATPQSPALCWQREEQSKHLMNKTLAALQTSGRKKNLVDCPIQSLHFMKELKLEHPLVGSACALQKTLILLPHPQCITAKLRLELQSEVSVLTWNLFILYFLISILTLSMYALMCWSHILLIAT